MQWHVVTWNVFGWDIFSRKVHTASGKWNNRNKSFNLKGIFLGSPLLDPAVQIKVHPLLRSLGYIDGNQMESINECNEQIIYDIKSENYRRANHALYAYFFSEDSILTKETGLKNLFNCENPYTEDSNHYYDYINSSKVRRSIHVGDLPFDDGRISIENFAPVFLAPVTPYLTKIINDTKILMYAGQYYVICSYQLISKILLSLDWYGTEAYRNVERVKLYRDGTDDVWGYMKNYETLTNVFVRKARHSAVSKQPIDTLNLLLSFTEYNRFIWKKKILKINQFRICNE